MANAFICLASPSKVVSSQSTSQTNTTITISWKRPGDGGRNDLYYIIEYRPQGSLGSFIGPSRREDTGVMDYTYTIRNLEPDTNYLITVTAENGVSDQEPDLRGTRTVEIQALTPEGCKLSTLTVVSFRCCTGENRPYSVKMTSGIFATMAIIVP